MASLDLHEKANFTRLCRLLVDKGTKALKTTLDTIHPPATLPAVLNAHRLSLLKLKPRVINNSQWDLLFPPCGNPPDSKTFDITLVSILLRNIRGLHAPASGWNTMPPDTDNSLQANITRIKLFRNQVYAHAAVAQVDQITFEHFWQIISRTLLHLKIPQKEIDDLRNCPLGPEEEIYLQKLEEWKLNDDDCKKMLANVQQQLFQVGVQQRDDRENLESSMRHLTQLFEETHRGVQQLCSSTSKLSEGQRQTSNFEQMQASQKLAKHNFKSKIRSKLKFFHPGTREWLLNEVDNWFTTDKEPRLLLITAGPGFGKSVFAAKVCEVFREKGKLAACHFCDFSDTNLKNPMTMLQSLASHMCDNITGFKGKLDDQLSRPHKVLSLKDAFQIYLQNPLDELELEPSLIVIDGLDESATDGKSEMVKLIADYFPELPECVKVLITSRPGLSLQGLKNIPRIEIKADNDENDSDLLQYLTSSLPRLSARDAVNPPSPFCHSNSLFSKILPALVEKCEGSFLYAFHVQHELSRRENVDTISPNEILACLPEGMDSVYKKYFYRLEIELKEVMNESTDWFKLLEMFVAAQKPLPLNFIARALGLDADCREVRKIINKVNEAVSYLLYVSDDLVTVFHKSVYDWLLAQGYQDHEYVVKIKDGKKTLWLVCEQIFKEIKTKVVSVIDERITTEESRALICGHSYLLACNMEESFSWFVDMIILYLLSSVHSHIFNNLKYILRDVLQSDRAIGLPLEKRISWHLVENSYEKFHLSLRMPYFLKNEVFYLQSVLEQSPEGCFTGNEKKIAETILKKHTCVLRRHSIVRKPIKSLLAKVFPVDIVAIGISSNKKLAAIALKDGEICVLSLPDLAKLWQCSTEYEFISCCTFAPDDSFLLYGTLQTALDIAERKKVVFFKERMENFKSCAFSPCGKRLVTVDGSNVLKVWDVVKQSLTAALSAGSPVDYCSFSNTGLYITADMKNGSEDSYCAWNAITFQRVDQRRFSVSVAKHGLPKSKKCIRCFFQETKELISFTALEFAMAVSTHLVDHVQLTMSLAGELRRECSEASTGTYNGLGCFFCFNEHSLRVIENTHFTTLAAWEIYVKPCRVDEELSILTTIIDIIAIKDDLWLYGDNETLVIFSTLPPKRHGSSLACATRILWCCFSPDGTRLATYTSDGFVNLWNVDDGLLYHRFQDNVETSSAACWWSNDHLFVFHVIDKIPSLSKYPVNENFKTPRKPVQLLSVVEEFLQFSRIIDFSEGLLSFECDEKEPVKLLDVTRIGNPEVIILPGNRPLMSITVSVGASFVLGVDNVFIFLWKRSDAQSTIYELFLPIQLSMFSQFEGSLLFESCFSSDSKYAVASFVTCRSRFFVVIDVNTGEVTTRGVVNGMFFSPPLKAFKVFCTDSVIVLLTPTFVEILELSNLKYVGLSAQRSITEDLLIHSKLSSKRNILALPVVSGDMGFFQLNIQKSCLVSSEVEGFMYVPNFMLKRLLECNKC